MCLCHPSEQFTEYVFHSMDEKRYRKCNYCGVVMNSWKVEGHVCDPAFVIKQGESNASCGTDRVVQGVLPSEPEL